MLCCWNREEMGNDKRVVSVRCDERGSKGLSAGTERDVLFMNYGTISKTVPWLKSATFVDP